MWCCILQTLTVFSSYIYMCTCNVGCFISDSTRCRTYPYYQVVTGACAIYYEHWFSFTSLPVPVYWSLRAGIHHTLYVVSDAERLSSLYHTPGATSRWFVNHRYLHVTLLHQGLILVLSALRVILDSSSTLKLYSQPVVPVYISWQLWTSMIKCLSDEY